MASWCSARQSHRCSGKRRVVGHEKLLRWSTRARRCCRRRCVRQRRCVSVVPGDQKICGAFFLQRMLQRSLREAQPSFSIGGSARGCRQRRSVSRAPPVIACNELIQPTGTDSRWWISLAGEMPAYRVTEGLGLGRQREKHRRMYWLPKQQRPITLLCSPSPPASCLTAWRGTTVLLREQAPKGEAARHAGSFSHVTVRGLHLAILHIRLDGCAGCP